MDMSDKSGFSVPEALKRLGELYRERNEAYGNNYLMHGKAMVAMFPRGVHLTTEMDFNRFAVFIHIMTKVSRYAQQFHRGGHNDSLDDTSVYAQILRHIDEVVAVEEREKQHR